MPQNGGVPVVRTLALCGALCPAMVSPAWADYIVPIAAHSPQVVVSLTNQVDNVGDLPLFALPTDTYLDTPDASPNPGSPFPLGGSPHYSIATFDTGSPLMLVDRPDYDAFGIASSGFDGINTIPVGGVGGDFIDAPINDAMGIHVASLAAVTGSGPVLSVDTTRFRGHYNVSAVSAPAGERLPNVVGTPLVIQYTTVLDYGNPQLVTVGGSEYRSPDVTLNPLGSLSPSNRVQITIVGDTEPLFLFNPFSSALHDDPLLPTLAASFYFNNNIIISHNGNSRNNLRLIDDSGSQGSFVSEQVAATLGHFVDTDDPDFVVRLEGVTGTVSEVPGFFADSLSFVTTAGNVTMENVPLIIFNLTDVDGMPLDGLIGGNLFGDRKITINPQVSNPFVAISDSVLDNHDWASGSASASFNSAGSWASPGTPALDWIAHVQNNAGVDQTAVVGSDASVSALNIIGDAQTMTVSIGSAAELTVFGTVIVQDNGALHMDGGKVSPLGVELRGGALTGSGDVGGEFISRARIAPGVSAGVLHFIGNFDQLKQGTTEIEFGGFDNSNPGSPQFDQLLIDEFASVSGRLSLSLIGGFVPSLEESVEILIADELLGHFDTVLGVLDEPGVALAVTYLADRVVVTAAIPGDFDLDRSVSLGDLGLLAANFNQAGFFIWSDGDADGDGDVDLADLGILANFFNTAAASLGLPTTLPEPASLIVLAAGMVVMLTRRGTMGLRG